MEELSTMRFGILLALLTLVFGMGLGGAFGLAEDGIKSSLQTRADGAPDEVYQGDEAKLKKTTGKSWTYFKRAHLHANGLGAISVCLILLLGTQPARRVVRSGAALCLGAGSLFYSLYWLLAGIRAPALGSTGAAKESLAWLAIPSAGMCIVGLVAVLAVTVTNLFRKEAAGSIPPV